MTLSTTVIVPFKSLASGKSRLAGILSDKSRQTLCVSLLRHTLDVVSGIGRVLLVSDDEEVGSQIGAYAGLYSALKPRAAGDLNKAIDEARGHVPRGHSALVVPTDLAILDRLTLQEFLCCKDALSMAPDSSEEGTNLLYLPAQAVHQFRFQFGSDSFKAHLAESRRIGFAPRIFHSERSAFDLDTPSDLRRLRTPNFETKVNGFPFLPSFDTTCRFGDARLPFSFTSIATSR